MFDLQKFLQEISRSFDNYQKHGARSNKKLVPIHQFLANSLKDIFGDKCTYHHLGENSKEKTVDGKYYPKDIDIAVEYEGKIIFCLGVKFVVTNFKQNANNYFETMMGETANIQRNNIHYAHLIILRKETPYKKNDGQVAKTEIITQKDLKKYINLVFDANQAHNPFGIGILLVDINEDTLQVKATDLNAYFDQNFIQLLYKTSLEYLFIEIKLLKHYFNINN